MMRLTTIEILGAASLLRNKQAHLVDESRFLNSVAILERAERMLKAFRVLNDCLQISEHYIGELDSAVHELRAAIESPIHSFLTINQND